MYSSKREKYTKNEYGGMLLYEEIIYFARYNKYLALKVFKYCNTNSCIIMIIYESLIKLKMLTYATFREIILKVLY